MRYSSIPLAQTIVQHLVAKDIAHIVISPGSRNAPLTISFTEHPFFSCYSIVDERCAAFFALGMAQQLKRPVAVVCTSGSALLNYYPAVAEAFYSQVPLVIISADRPSYKIDVGDGQTIRQDNVFARHIGYSAHLRQDLAHAVSRIERYRPQWLQGAPLQTLQEGVQDFNDREIDKALAIAFQQGLPVHLNTPFEEPLYDFLEAPSTLAKILPLPKEGESLPDFGPWAAVWKRAKRKMVLVGVNPPDTMSQALLNALGQDPSVLVLTETTSNLHHPQFLNSIDSLVAPMELSGQKGDLFEKLRPELLVTFGGLVVSKKIKAFLREHTPENHWHIGGTRAYDTFFCLTEHLKATPQTFFDAMYADGEQGVSDYQTFGLARKWVYGKKRHQYVANIPFSDFLAFHILFQSIPKGYQLQLANSSTVRYAQLFDVHPSLRVFCNRGTSGIDGSTSTAIGAALQDERPTLLITGDLSFFYDSNALWNNYMRNDFRIVVINNGGGGIFRILPGKEETENFGTFFETKHHLNAKGLCETFGVGYARADNEASLHTCLTDFFGNSRKPQLLEIFTPRISNNKILLDYFHFIS
jgi:2-succinyl-5-enolpyruvyl-6-hydroxy-3-cyclohexene-1-carboxylate synthase